MISEFVVQIWYHSSFNHPALRFVKLWFYWEESSLHLINLLLSVSWNMQTAKTDDSSVVNDSFCFNHPLGHVCYLILYWSTRWLNFQSISQIDTYWAEVAWAMQKSSWATQRLLAEKSSVPTLTIESWSAHHLRFFPVLLQSHYFDRIYLYDEVCKVLLFTFEENRRFQNSL